MKPVVLLVAALLAAAAVFVLFDTGPGEPPPGTEGAPEVYERPASRNQERPSARAPEAPPLAPIPPAADEETDAEPVDLEAGAPETGLYGEILTPTGSALEDAIVTLYRTEGRSILDERRVRVAAPVHTDDEGVYRVTGLEGGDDYLLHVEHGAFASAELRGLAVEEGRLRRVPDVRLETGVIIEGIVTGPDRRGLDGAVVQAIVVSDRRRPIVRQVLTDERGAYRLVGLTPGAYEVAVSAEGMETVRSSPFTLLSDRAQRRFDAQLAEAKAIAGVVTTPDGRPLDGARVTAQRLRGGPSRGSDRTGADGRFEIGGLGEGEYSVTVERNGFVRRTEHGVVAPRKNLRLPLVPTVGVSGTVRDPAGEPVPAFFVRAWRTSPEGRLSDPIGEPRKVRSKDGSYTLDGFTPGSYRVEVFAPGFAPSTSRPFEVKRLYVNGVDVRMKEGAALTGVVVDGAGRAFEGATVRLLSNAFRPGPAADMLYDASQRLDRTRTDETGRFRFEGLNPGKYQLEISAKDHRRQYERDIQVGGVETVEVGPFTLTEGGHLEGTVVDARNVPANAATISLSTDDEGVLRQVRADDDGTFSFRNLDPGTYRVNAAVTGTGSTSDDIFAQALRTLKGGVEVAVLEGRTVPVTLYVD